VADNGAEMMHKLLNGQPGEAMPALRALDHQVAADIAVHLATLPAK
jgi:thiosulfate dehydrogenase